MECTYNMKMTPVGLIPEDWDVATIKDFGYLLSDGINPQQYRGRDFVEYSMPAYDDGQSPTKCKGADMNSNRTQIQGEVLLFNKLNVRQKRVWYIENAPSNALCSMEFLAYSSDKVDLRLLREILLQDSVTKSFESVSRGTSNSQKRIAPSDFLYFSFALPPLAEQHRIADALSAVDELIGVLDEAIAKKRQIKEGLMRQLLTGRTRLSGYKATWEEFTFQTVFTSVSDRGRNVDTTEYKESGLYPIIDQSQNAIAGYTDKSNPIVPTHCGYIVFGDHTRIFKYVEQPFFTGADGTRVLSVSNKFDTKFVYYYSQMLDIPNTGYNRHFKYLKASRFVMPDVICEQKEISSIFTAADTEIQSLEAERDKYILIKQGMMQELLTGKTRLI